MERQSRMSPPFSCFSVESAMVCGKKRLKAYLDVCRTKPRRATIVGCVLVLMMSSQSRVEDGQRVAPTKWRRTSELEISGLHAAIIMECGGAGSRRVPSSVWCRNRREASSDLAAPLRRTQSSWRLPMGVNLQDGVVANAPRLLLSWVLGDGKRVAGGWERHHRWPASLTELTVMRE